jgi:C1A family cysteine protease
LSFSHALLAVGYSDQSQSFIVRNSWGENWVRHFCFILIVIVHSSFQGDKGYCYIPYDYITNSDLSFDIWTIRKVATDDFGQDHWDNDDSTDYTQSNNQDDFDENNQTIEDLDDDDE